MRAEGLKDDFLRAATGYAGPKGRVVRVSVPAEMAQRARQVGGPNGDQVEFFFHQQADVEVLNQTFEVLPQKQAFLEFLKGRF